MKMTKQGIAELLLKANDDCSNVEICGIDDRWRKTEVETTEGLLDNICRNDFYYRIKPEPEFVPYSQYDAREFLGEKFVGKENGRIIIPLDYNDVGFFFANGSEISLIWYDYLFKYYTKLDGTPAGRRVNEN